MRQRRKNEIGERPNAETDAGTKGVEGAQDVGLLRRVSELILYVPTLFLVATGGFVFVVDRMSDRYGLEGDYGIDESYFVAEFAIGALCLMLVGLVAVILRRRLISLIFFLPSFVFLVIAFHSIYGSLQGKFDVLNKIASKVEFRRDMQILDLGCGSGLFSILIGRKMLALCKNRPCIHSMDMFTDDFLLGNTKSRFHANVDAEHLPQDLFELVKGDIVHDMPMDQWKGKFDLVVSSLAVHEEALEKILQIAKPKGGRIILWDTCKNTTCPILQVQERLSQMPDQVSISNATPVDVFSPSYIVQAILK